MKKALGISVCTAVFISTYASMPMAQDSKMPAPNPTSTTTQSDSSMNMAKQTGSIDAHMKNMQALHDKMSAAATPEARQKIMAEQRQEMQQGMALMKPMMHGGGGMGAMGGGMMAQKDQPGDASMQMMQKRMDMMQMMMQTMMDHHGMLVAPQSPVAQPKK